MTLPPPKGLSPGAVPDWQIMADALGDEAAGRVEGLLVVYAEARARARAIAAQIDAFDMKRLDDPEGLAIYDKLTGMAFRTSSLIGLTLTKLGVTQQCRMEQSTAHRRATDPRASAQPWETIE